MKHTFLTLFVIATFCVKAQVGKPFPVIEGETLDGKPMHLPPNNGKYTVVAIAFNKNAEDALKKWLNPLYETFMDKSKKPNMDMGETYDVNFYFVPMIAGFKKVADEFKAGTDKEFWPHVVDTKKSDISVVQAQLGVKDNKIPYFYVVDKAGKVVAMQSGSFTDDKMETLEEGIQ